MLVNTKFSLMSHSLHQCFWSVKVHCAVGVKIMKSVFLKYLKEFAQNWFLYLVTLLKNYILYIGKVINSLWFPFNSQLPFESCLSVISIVLYYFRIQTMTIS